MKHTIIVWDKPQDKIEFTEKDVIIIDGIPCRGQDILDIIKKKKSTDKN